MLTTVRALSMGVNVNVNNNRSWQNLKDHFRSAGTVVYADVMMEPSGRSKGFGIVEFETAAEVR